MVWTVLFVLFAFALPLIAGAETQSGTCGDNLTWTLTDSGVMTISGTGPMTDYQYISVPWSKDFTELYVEEGVTNISGGTFNGCAQLTKVTLSSTVASIGDQAFMGCASLQEFSAPGSPYFSTVDGILFSADGSTLVLYPPAKTASTYTVPGTVSRIADNAFAKCPNLTSVTLPDSVTSIGHWAFYGNEALTAVNIPEGVKRLNYFTFGWCTALEQIILPSTLQIIDDDTFYNCASLKSISIPDGVTSIGRYAFSKCASMTDIMIPDSVTKIGNSAFDGCTALQNVQVTTCNSFAHQWFASQQLSDLVHALDHDWEPWTVTRQATVSEEGEEQRVCKRDASHVETRIIPKIEEDEDDFTPGNVSGDSEKIVDGRDLLRLARFLAGEGVEIDRRAADVNGDGTVDGRDLLRLAKYLAGADIQLVKSKLTEK